MKVRYNGGKYFLITDGDVITSNIIKFDMDDRRKEILFEWAQKQIDVINENGFRHVTGAFFTYVITPTGVGEEISVHCRSTDSKLDLSLIDDEEW